MSAQSTLNVLMDRFQLTSDQLQKAALEALVAVQEAGMLAPGATPQASLLASVAAPAETLARLEGLITITERLAVDAMSIHAVVGQLTVAEGSTKSHESHPE